MHQSRISLGIIVVNYLRPQGSMDVARAVVADAQTHGIECSCVIVDNSASMAKEGPGEQGNIRVIALPNPGYAAALNTATVNLETSHYVFLTHEVVWRRGNLVKLLKPFKDGDVAATGPLLLDKESGRIWSAGCQDINGVPRHVTNVPAAVPAYDVTGIDGSAWVVAASALAQIGPLDEDYFLYWEETDWQRRALLSGYRIVLVPSASAKCGPNKAADMTYYLQRNRFTFLARYVSMRRAIRAALGQVFYYGPREIIGAMMEPSRRDERMVRAWARLRAVVDWRRGHVGKR